MADNETDPYEREFQEVIQYVAKRYKEFVSDSGSSGDPIECKRDPVDGSLYIKKHGESVTGIKLGQISADEEERYELGELAEWEGKGCLICNGVLRVEFHPEFQPPLKLVCRKCERVHRVAEKQLCLTDD